ncbi:MAG: DUF1295 domain-containing protein [Pseudobdellovibrionaceae bacterium]
MSVWSSGFWTAIILFQLVWIPAFFFRKNDLADVLWGPAFPLCAFAGIYFSGRSLADLGLRQLVVVSLITVWALRLFVHVGWRNLSHRQEDVRYNNWRKAWGSTWIWRSYLQVFVLQPLILYAFLLPVLFILASPGLPIGIAGYAGVLFWMVGFFFESVGDEQLRRFKADGKNRGQLMTKGLWSWTRHPNYFGEVLLWWGIWLLAIELPGAWWTIAGPFGVTYLLLKVSGVSMLEDLMRSRPGYAEYEKSVSRFFPRPPPRRLDG